MTHIRRLATALTAALLLTGGVQGQAPAHAIAAAAAGGIVGTWMNPHGSVAVRTGACGDKLCGWIVWASAEAQADARDGGTAHLVGTALLEDYKPNGAGSWSGTVFVPDRGQRFYSELNAIDANAMKVKGCILHGLICRSQIWRRVAEVPHG